jgi:hypothetical protein
MIAKAENGLVRPFPVFIIVKEPVRSAMAEPAISNLVRIRRKPVDRAVFAIILPKSEVKLTILVERRDDNIAAPIIAFGKTGTGIAPQAQYNTFNGIDFSSF